jgi:LexA-binding, inner membrane-associated putative hydrolase
MMARSHVLAGAAGWLAAAPQVAQATGHPLHPGTLAASTVVCAGAALLPDLDHEHGTLAYALGPVSKVTTEIIADLSGGHRHATHSLVFGAGMGLLAAVALTSRWLLMLSLAGFLAATAIRALELPRVGWPKSYAVAALATAAAARWLPGPHPGDQRTESPAGHRPCRAPRAAPGPPGCCAVTRCG